MQALPKYISPAVTITPDTSIYTANDVIGGLLQFPITGSVTGGGLINKLIVCDNDNEGAAGALWLFSSAPVTIVDQAPFAPVIADLQAVSMIITLPSFTTVNSLKIAVLEDINTHFMTTNSILYGYFVCSGGPTYASAKLIYIKLGILTEG